MNIFGHLIPDGAILGIGPLQFERHQNEKSFAIYGTGRHWFQLHLAAHTTVVNSDWFNPKENDEEQQKIKRYREEYAVLRERISTLIGEPSETRKDHITQVGDLYESLKDQMNGLLADLEPTKPKHVALNARVSRLFDDLRDFRNLACK